MSTSTTTDQVVLAARGLSAGYDSTPVVRDLDLEVRAGEVTALLGPNGAGKTTTLMTLAGDLPAMGGTVELLGTTTAGPMHRRARAGLGLVTEQRAVLSQLSVNDNFRVARCDRDQALELFPELVAHLDRRVGLLSGGQQQMLALACALARKPKVLLADELSLGLAPLVVARLLAAVRSAADSGVGVLLVEQHVPKVLDIADTVHVMQRGRVVLSGAASELRSRVEDIQASYFADAAATPGQT